MAWSYTLPSALAGDTPFRISPDGGPSGGTCYQAGEITDSGKTSALLLAPDDGTFIVQVKCSSETGYDFAKVKLLEDELTELATIYSTSGTKDWTTRNIAVAAGQIVALIYEKDEIESFGEDTAWFDVAFMDAASGTPPTPPGDWTISTNAGPGGTPAYLIQANAGAETVKTQTVTVTDPCTLILRVKLAIGQGAGNTLLSAEYTGPMQPGFPPRPLTLNLLSIGSACDWTEFQFHIPAAGSFGLTYNSAAGIAGDGAWVQVEQREPIAATRHAGDVDYSAAPITSIGQPWGMAATGGPDGGPCYQAPSLLGYLPEFQFADPPLPYLCDALITAPAAGFLIIGFQIAASAADSFVIDFQNGAPGTEWSIGGCYLKGSSDWQEIAYPVRPGDKLYIHFDKMSGDSTAQDSARLMVAFTTSLGTNTPSQTERPMTAGGYVSFAASARLRGVRVDLPMTAAGSLSLSAAARLLAQVSMSARSFLTFAARVLAEAPAPSGLAAKLYLVTERAAPSIVLDQYLLVWFNGDPQTCKIALQFDDEPESEPAALWSNAPTRAPAIMRIDSAAIPADGRIHRVRVHVWHQAGAAISPRSSFSFTARTATTRPTISPRWCDARVIRQATPALGDLCEIRWDHPGPVQLYARWTKGPRVKKALVGSGSAGDATALIEDIALRIGATPLGQLVSVTVGVAALVDNIAGPITWAVEPILIQGRDKPQPSVLGPDGAVPEESGATLEQRIVPEMLQRFPQVPEHQARAIIAWTIPTMLNRIKAVVAAGGAVELKDLGVFSARWNGDFSTRSPVFFASVGLSRGTRLGQVLTDAQAKEIEL